MEKGSSDTVSDNQDSVQLSLNYERQKGGHMNVNAPATKSLMRAIGATIVICGIGLLLLMATPIVGNILDFVIEVRKIESSLEIN